MVLKDLAERLAADLAAGAPSRQTIDTRAVVFAEGGNPTGLPITLAAYVTQATVDGTTFGATSVAASGTPVAPVPPDGVKPDIVTITTATHNLVKYAGKARVTLEQVLSSAGLLGALNNVLGRQMLMAFDAAGTAAMVAGAGQTVPAATSILNGIAQGQALVLSKGGSPSIAVVPAADWAALAGEVSNGAGFATDPRSPVGSIYGSAIVVSPSATQLVVADGGAVLAVVNSSSPSVLLDPYSESAQNAVNLVGDLLGGWTVMDPDLVVAVTVGP